MIKKIVIASAFVAVASGLHAAPNALKKSALAIAGVEANMPAPQVEIALARAGFTKSVDNKELDFGQRVNLAVHNARGNSTGRNYNDNSPSYQEWRKGGERLVVFFNQSPQGAIVRLVRYELPGTIQTGPEVAAELVKRFGPPSLKAWNKITGNTAHWCKLKTPKECDRTTDNLALSGDANSILIFLHADSRLEKHFDALIAAEARKRSGGASY